MKTRFDNRQLAHVWAQQNQPEGSGSSFFFVGPSIYSYGRHFEIARFITRKGARAVLFTTRRYSVTTSKHISHVHGALRGLAVPVFYVPDIDHAARGDDATRDTYRQRVRDAVECSAKRRRPDSAAREIENARAMVDEANRYAAFFGKRWRVKVPDDSPEAREALRVKLAAYQARQREKTKRDLAKKEKANREALAEWRRHERATIPNAHALSVALRVTQSANGPAYIETTRGAMVPAAVARLVWDAVAFCVARGEGVQFGRDAAPRLGSFTLDRIDGAGNVTAGCHVLPYSELHALAVHFGFVPS